LRELGADHAILYKDNDWAAEVKKALGLRRRRCSTWVAGDYLPKNLQLLNRMVAVSSSPSNWAHGDDQRRPADGEST